MAKSKKKARRGGPGGGDRGEQIAKLEERVGPKGKKKAREIVETYEPDVIRLAFKMIPKVGPPGLGKRIEGLLAGMDANEAAEIRSSLLAAKAEKNGR